VNLNQRFKFKTANFDFFFENAVSDFP